LSELLLLSKSSTRKSEGSDVARNRDRLDRTDRECQL